MTEGFAPRVALGVAWAPSASADIALGARVVTTQPLPEGIPEGAAGTVIGEAGWIQRRWRVRFDTASSINVPEYALDARPRSAASTANLKGDSPLYATTVAKEGQSPLATGVAVYRYTRRDGVPA